MSYVAKTGVMTKGGVYHRPGTRFTDLAEFDQPERLIAAGHITDLAEFDQLKPEPRPEGRGEDITPSPWMFDPEAIKAKKLDELNVMILEVDDSVEPFTTKKEAIAWLSQDFVPA